MIDYSILCSFYNIPFYFHLLFSLPYFSPHQWLAKFWHFFPMHWWLITSILFLFIFIFCIYVVKNIFHLHCFMYSFFCLFLFLVGYFFFHFLSTVTLKSFHCFLSHQDSLFYFIVIYFLPLPHFSPHHWSAKFYHVFFVLVIGNLSWFYLFYIVAGPLCLRSEFQCANGGLCQEDRQGNTTTCACPTGYIGATCQTPINENFCEADTHPCQVSPSSSCSYISVPVLQDEMGLSLSCLDLTIHSVSLTSSS